MNKIRCSVVLFFACLKYFMCVWMWTRAIAHLVLQSLSRIYASIIRFHLHFSFLGSIKLSVQKHDKFIIVYNVF